jgi:hypothetical protein
MTDDKKESFKLEMNELGDRLTKLVHEGNVRRVVVKRDNETLAEFPLTAGVVGVVVTAMLAPVLAAIGAIAALVANCTIEIERTDQKDESADEAPGADSSAEPPGGTPS